jgi:hypothetical protein
MKIRNEQMDAFSKSREDAFIARMGKHLQTQFPKQLGKQGLEKEDLEPLVRQGIADAEQYGVIYEDDIRRYVECMVILGPKFDRDKKHHPWAGEILRNEDLDGEEKMDQIAGHIIFEIDEPPITEPAEDLASREESAK